MRAQFVYDEKDIITFQQGGAAVDAYDASENAITTTGVTSDVLNMEAAKPGHIGLSVYVRPLKDVDGVGIGGTGDPVVVATLLDGATSTPTTARVVRTQNAQTEVMEIPLPQDVLQYLAVKVASDGGGASNSIATGAVQVWIGESGQLA